jgi:hypothetical protein
MDDEATLIEREVASWPGVTVRPHRFGGVEFHVHQHEIGHLHGNRLADLPFPVRMRQELVAAGRALPHHILPDTGWVSFSIRGAEDVPAALALFRLNYDRLARRSLATADAGGPISDEMLDEYDEVIEDSFPASDPPPGPISIL